MTVHYRDCKGNCFNRDFVFWCWSDIQREATRMGWSIDCFIPFPHLVAGMTQGEISELYKGDNLI